MSSIYFLKVEVEDAGNSLDASSSHLTIIKVNGNQFFFTKKKALDVPYKLYTETVCVQVVHSGWCSYSAKNRNLIIWTEILTRVMFIS